MARLRHTLNDYSKQQSTKIVVECGVICADGVAGTQSQKIQSCGCQARQWNDNR